MTKAHMLRVFVDGGGRFGDSAPVIIDEGRRISDDERLALAVRLGAAETVFVNNLAAADISIMHLQGEVDFAGTPALGAAWLLSRLQNRQIGAMKGRKGEIKVSSNGDVTWVRADLATMPPWHHKQLANAGEVEALTLEDTANLEHTMVWAWVDQDKGLIRARTFAADWDIPEAQGNGSGSMMLASMLGGSLVITHGEGCVIYAKPAPDNCADIGGRVIEEESVEL